MEIPNLSHLCTAGHSWRKLGVNFRWSGLIRPDPTLLSFYKKTNTILCWCVIIADCCTVTAGWLVDRLCSVVFWLQGSAPKVAPFQHVGIPAAADLSFRPCPHLTLPVGLGLYNVAHWFSVADTNLHGCTHMCRQSKQTLIIHYDIRTHYPEEKSEAHWVVAVAHTHKAETDKYRSMWLRITLVLQFLVLKSDWQLSDTEKLHILS